MSPAAWLVLIVAGTSPLGAIAWVRWRFRPARMHERADQLLADAEANARALDDAALIARFEEPLGSTPASRRVKGLVVEKRYAVLLREWHGLWPELVNTDKMSLDRAIELGAAIKILAERHP